MERNKIKLPLKNVCFGFAPGALFIMITIAIVLPFFFSRGNFEVVKGINFGIFLMEILLLSSGYFLMLLFLNPLRLALTIWRSVLAGILSVVILAMFSIFLQGASLQMIVVASILAGIISSLSNIKTWTTR